GYNLPLEMGMPDTPINQEPDLKKSAGRAAPILAYARRRSTIYVSAVALALAAALGAASFEAVPARAVGEQSTAHAVGSQSAQHPLSSFAPLVKRVKAAVVSIRVKAKASAKVALQDDDDQNGNENPFEGTPFERFFNGPNAPFRNFKQPNGRGPIVMAQGSGF